MDMLYGPGDICNLSIRTLSLYVKSKDPFKMFFKLKLYSFVSILSLFKKGINAFDSLGI